MTFEVAAEEARRIGGEVIPMDLRAARPRARRAHAPLPDRPVAAITPFNFPLNLAAHKLAPGDRGGQPGRAQAGDAGRRSRRSMLAELSTDAGVPKGALSVLPCTRQAGDRLVTDERFKLLTFTGSSAVGWAMKARAGKKKVVLELGGNAGVIVDETRRSRLRREARRCGGFALAGQSCISVQRVFVHRRVFERVRRSARRAASRR